MTAKHTKGPLEVGDVTGYRVVKHVIESETKLTVAEVYGGTQEEAEANARLFAGSDGLLEAAQEALRLIEWLHLMAADGVEIYKHELRSMAALFESRIAPAITKATEEA